MVKANIATLSSTVNEIKDNQNEFKDKLNEVDKNTREMAENLANTLEDFTAANSSLRISKADNEKETTEQKQ
jgi:predicted nuclease with TOPRIM domain